jgi:hypothetical protein
VSSRFENHALSAYPCNGVAIVGEFLMTLRDTDADRVRARREHDVVSVARPLALANGASSAKRFSMEFEQSRL